MRPRWAAVAAVVMTASACRVQQDAPPAPAASTSFPPDPTGKPFVFAVKGDWGAGTDAQRKLTARMCAHRRRVPFHYVVTTGDNFYDPDGTATQGNFYVPERCLVSYRRHRWRATWGNHDVRGDSTSTVLGAPGRYYSWRAGDAEFFMLDSNASSDAPQRGWLENALEGSRARVGVAVFHHPPFTTGVPHPSDNSVRRNWIPLFERYGVDLVLTGHNHVYEHSVVRGIHYVVSGGGGQALYRCGRRETWLRRCAPEHHFLIVRVANGLVALQSFGVSGQREDSFSFEYERAEAA